MIDLRNTCVLVKTPEENEKLLKEAEKQLEEVQNDKT